MSEGLNDGYLSNMKEFRYVDKVNNVAFRGIVPNNDKNCPPFLFFRLSHAYYLEKLFSDKVKASGLAPMPVNDNAKVYQKIIQKYTTSTECCKGTKSLLYITYC